MKRPLLDKFDDAILALLQANARLPVAEIAAHIGLSEPACYRRIRQLRENGAIEREVAVVNASALGWPLGMIVLVSLETDRSSVVDKLLKRLQGIPEVLDVWYVTGDHDFVLQVIAQDMAHFETFARKALHSEANVKSFKTLVVMRHGKKQAAIPAAIGK
jgi:Lrp/AsnC family transcriptional regulator, leucine-responsive regulatory protein